MYQEDYLLFRATVWLRLNPMKYAFEEAVDLRQALRSFPVEGRNALLHIF